MANEITYSALLGFTKAGVSASKGTPNLTMTMTGVNYEEGTMQVPTTAGGTAIPKGSVGTIGKMWVKNKDVTNFLTILNATSGSALIKVLPGSEETFYCAAAAPAALADTAIVEMDYLMIEA